VILLPLPLPPESWDYNTNVYHHGWPVNLLYINIDTVTYIDTGFFFVIKLSFIPCDLVSSYCFCAVFLHRK
jgi:hypothetical protein